MPGERPSEQERQEWMSFTRAAMNRMDCKNPECSGCIYMKEQMGKLLTFIELSSPAPDVPPLPEGTVPPFRWASSGLSSHVIDSSEKPNWFCDDTKYMCECIAYALNTVYGKEKS